MKTGPQLHVQIIVSRKDADNKRLLSPLTNHRGQGKSTAHGQKFGPFNRVEFKDRSEAVFDQQQGYERAVQERFHYQNTMSHSTAQERADLLVMVWDQERERERAAEQQRQAEQLRQAEQQRQAEQLRQQQQQARRQEQEQLLRQEPQRRRGLSL